MYTMIRNEMNIVASNTQLAERWVKDANTVTYLNRDEKFSNILAIIRSRTVLAFHDIAVDDNKHRTRKASHQFTRGCIGERLSKETGELEKLDETKRDKLKGAILISSIINQIIQMHKQIQSANIPVHIKNNINKFAQLSSQN